MDTSASGCCLSGIYVLPNACTIIDRLDISEIEAGYKGGGTSSYNLRKYIALGAPGRSVAVGSCL
ncbi:MAG: hypothetical protein II476_04895 [Bacteroidales bacterium]|nr:hypothetical protein [Bacteroidales bacterium]